MLQLFWVQDYFSHFEPSGQKRKVDHLAIHNDTFSYDKAKTNLRGLGNLNDPNFFAPDPKTFL